MVLIMKIMKIHQKITMKRNHENSKDKEKSNIVEQNSSEDYNSDEKLESPGQSDIPCSTFDAIIDKLGINWYNMRIYIILSLFFLADGAEMIVISLLITKLGEIWDLCTLKKA